MKKLLSIKNEVDYQEALSNILSNRDISDEFFIKSFKNSPNLDVNKPTIIKVKYEQDEVFHDEERLLLMQAIQSNRSILVQHLVDKGAKLLPDPNEVNSLLNNTNVSDVINCLENSSDLDVNKPIIIKVRYGQDEVFHDEEHSLLTQAIQSKRLELVKYLVTKGADVNFSAPGATKPYMKAYYQGIKFFEALVDSGKLVKDELMTYYNISLDDELSLNLSDLYDVITWKNNIQASILSFNKWFNTDKIHFFENLLKAYQKFSNIKITYLKDDPLIKQAQDIIAQGQEISKTIKKHFSEHWQQNMLVCKNFDAESLLSIAELNKHIARILHEI